MAKKQFSLFLYGELSFDEEETLEQHLDACAACRQALEQERTLHRAADLAEMIPSRELLERSRSELQARLLAEQRRPVRESWRAWLQRSWTIAFSPSGFARPLGALALVALGFFSARLTLTNSPAPLQLGGLAEPALSRVRNIEPGPSGRVQIVVDETRQRVLTGRLEDDSIRRLLLSAAKDPADPGLRVESMDILKSRVDSSEVRGALVFALQHDSNPGVRLKALEGLRTFAREPETRKALAQVLLTDANPGVRTQAIDLLIQSKEQDVIGVLQELLRKEDNAYVRLRSQKALREMGASVETF